MKFTEEVFFRANQREFIDSLEQRTRLDLIRYVRDTQPDDCLTCMFYKAYPGKGECAIGYDSEIELRMKDKLCPVGGGVL